MSDKNGTWIKIFRDIQTHWLWEEKPFSKGQAWIDLLMLAKYQDEKFLDRRGNLINGKKGYIYRSIRSLAKRWGWSRDKAKNFLNMLQADGMITLSARQASEKTTIFIVNYGEYQQVPTSKKTSRRPVTDQSPTSQKPVADIYKKDKNYKEIKEIKESISPETENEDDLALGFSWDDVEDENEVTQNEHL